MKELFSTYLGKTTASIYRSKVHQCYFAVVSEKQYTDLATWVHCLFADGSTLIMDRQFIHQRNEFIEIAFWNDSKELIELLKKLDTFRYNSAFIIDRHNTKYSKKWNLQSRLF